MAGSQGPSTRPSAANPQVLLSLGGRTRVVDKEDVVDGVSVEEEAPTERSAILAQRLTCLV